MIVRIHLEDTLMLEHPLNLTASIGIILASYYSIL